MRQRLSLFPNSYDAQYKTGRVVVTFKTPAELWLSTAGAVGGTKDRGELWTLVYDGFDAPYFAPPWGKEEPIPGWCFI